MYLRLRWRTNIQGNENEYTRAWRWKGSLSMRNSISQTVTLLVTMWCDVMWSELARLSSQVHFISLKLSETSNSYIAFNLCSPLKVWGQIPHPHTTRNSFSKQYSQAWWQSTNLAEAPSSKFRPGAILNEVIVVGFPQCLLLNVQMIQHH